MYWLAINREPVLLQELQADSVAIIPSHDLLESLNSLQRRSLILDFGQKRISSRGNLAKKNSKISKPLRFLS
jgi:hypothetical protein